MKFDAQEVEHLAKLARLQLTEEEKQTYADQLSNVFKHFEKIKNIDTNNTEECYQITGLKNVYREDIVTESLDQELILNTTERDHRHGMIQVQKSL